MDNEDPTTVTNTVIPTQSIVPQFAKPALYENFSFTSAKSGLMPSAAFGDPSVRFGGDGSDGALSISSGTTTIDLGSAEVVTKNYSSIIITNTGALAFSSPNSAGSKIILKSLGNVILTSTTSPLIDVSNLGAAGGAAAANGTEGNFIINDTVLNFGNGTTAGLVLSSKGFYTKVAGRLSTKTVFLACGSGGAGGANGTDGNGGAGGAGGGVLVIECAGSLLFTGTINANGQAGANSTAGSGGRGGGGGGGAAGMILILYNTLTANTGTLNTAGGAGGTGGDSTAGAGNRGCGGGGGGGYGAQGGQGNCGSAGGAGGSTAGGGGGGGGQAATAGFAGGAAGASDGLLVTKNTAFA